MSSEKQDVALSLKQPWASLVVAGLKSIEVRTWSTSRRGRILIHAARIPDHRPEAWVHVPEELKPMTSTVGGIIGAAMLTGCIAYDAAAAFEADRGLHLNDPSWFHPNGMYGLLLCRAERLPFRRFPGNIKFFSVPS